MPSNITTGVSLNTYADQKEAKFINFYAHPSYKLRRNGWQIVSDVLAGEDVVKEKSRNVYLSDIAKNATSASEFEAYVKRAVFVNYTKKSLHGILSLLTKQDVAFSTKNIPIRKRDKKIDPDQLVTLQGDTTTKNISFQQFCREVARKTLAKGRCGLLTQVVNDDQVKTNIYRAEDIIDWKENNETGQLEYLLLRNIKEVPIYPWEKHPERNIDTVNRYNVTYKSYFIDPNTKQLIIREHDENMNEIGKGTINRRGNPIDFIPFVFINTTSNGADVEEETSLIEDIARANIAHYRALAAFKTSMHYASFPIYVVGVQPGAEETSEYQLSPNTVWEVPVTSSGTTAVSLLEVFGRGLDTMANHVQATISDISALGGKLSGISDANSKYSAGESFNTLFASDRGILNNVVTSIERGISKAFIQNLYLRDTYGGKVENWQINIEFSKRYRIQALSAMELRTAGVLVQNGVMAVHEMYKLLRESEFISESLSYEEFKAMIQQDKEQKLKDMEKEQELKIKQQKELQKQIPNNNPNNFNKNNQSKPVQNGPSPKTKINGNLKGDKSNFKTKTKPNEKPNN